MRALESSRSFASTSAVRQSGDLTPAQRERKIAGMIPWAPRKQPDEADGCFPGLRWTKGAVAAVLLGVSACTHGGEVSRPADVPFERINQLAYPETSIGFSSSFTLSTSGCFLAAITMAADYLNTVPPMSLPEANQLVKRHGGFTGALLHLDAALRSMGLQKEARRKLTTSSAPNLIAALDHAMTVGKPVLLGLDWEDGSRSGASAADHFLMVFRKHKGEYLGIDPAGGVMVALERSASGGLQYRGQPNRRISEMIFLDSKAQPRD